MGLQGKHKMVNNLLKAAYRQSHKMIALQASCNQKTVSKYSIIYADPPWVYSKGLKGSPANHYPLMKTEDIMRLPVQDISADNCALFLWVTFPRLQDGLNVLQAWGFRHVGEAFTWVKTNKIDGKPCIGIGQYTRHNAEPCLLGIKGSMARISKSVRSLVTATRGKHSQKPPEVRERIVELFGDIPRVELFARNNVDGWDAWGNQCENTIELTKPNRTATCTLVVDESNICTKSIEVTLN